MATLTITCTEDDLAKWNALAGEEGLALEKWARQRLNTRPGMARIPYIGKLGDPLMTTDTREPYGEKGRDTD